MFTGIIEEVGTLKGIRHGQKSSVVTIGGKKLLIGTKIGDSISTNGVCLTVTKLHKDAFDADVMPETLQRSNLGGLQMGGRVNLERALQLDTRLGGHIGPLGMLITGMIVAGMDMKHVFTSKKVYAVTFFRMILCPAIILLLLKLSNAASLVNNGTEILLITFLATVTPAASTVTQFAQVHDKNAA